MSHGHRHDHNGDLHDHGDSGDRPAAAQQSLHLFSPAGALQRAASLKRAAKRLAAHGFQVVVDPQATTRVQRFAGDDDTRLAVIHGVARAAPSVALATRGGYGLTRLLDRLDWKLLGGSVEQGTRWVGLSDLTSLQLGLLAHAGQGSWAGPLACEHFGRSAQEGGVDDVTEACFLEAMHGELEAVGFRTEAGFDGLQVRGTLWGGNLCVLNSLLGTPHLPRIKDGVLFLEDVNEHPYRIERSLLQLHQAGILDRQRAVLLGHFNQWTPSPNDRGYTLKTAIEHLRSVTRTPILTGLPFGHVQTLVCLPVGRKVDVVVQGRDVLVGWGH
jgi:muramoyltetrapeptide carboxypeptidase